MVCGFDGLQLNSGSHAVRGCARRYSCFGPVVFIIAPSSRKLAGALWTKPQRLWPTMGSDAAFDRPSAAATTPKMPPGRTAGSAAFAPALSTSSRLPSESPPTTEKMRAKKLVALGVSPVCRLHDSHGRDARATTLETQWSQQFRLPDRVPGEGMAKHIRSFGHSRDPMGVSRC